MSAKTNHRDSPTVVIEPIVAKYKVGDAIEGQYTGRANWYAATIEAIELVNGGTATQYFAYDLQFASCDRQIGVKEDKIRPRPTPTAPVMEEIVESTPVSVAKFKSNEVICSYVSEYDDWFEGRIKRVNPYSGSGEITYIVNYEDGDEENSVVESRLKYPSWIKPAKLVKIEAPVTSIPKPNTPIVFTALNEEYVVDCGESK